MERPQKPATRRAGFCCQRVNTMELTIATPALLFPGISLIMLAYTNRFLTLAQVARALSDRYRADPTRNIKAQLSNLRFRIRLIRDMQVFGVLSFFGCGLSMFVLFLGLSTAGALLFGISVVLLLISLALSLREIWVSVMAIELQLEDISDPA
jgi:hypothetical protein